MSVRLPKLWVLDVADCNVLPNPLVLPAGHNSSDFLCLRNSEHWRLFTRIACLPERMIDFTLRLSDTALIDDPFAHFKDVLAMLATIDTGRTRVVMKMKVTHSTIRRLYGELDPRWHLAKLYFKSRHYETPEKWEYCEVKMAKGDKYERVRIYPHDTAIELNRFRVQCEERHRWHEERSILVEATARTQGDIVATGHILDSLEHVTRRKRSFYENGWHIFTGTDTDILAAFDLVPSVLKNVSVGEEKMCKIELSRRGYVYRFDNVVPHNKPTEERMPNSRAHLQEQCACVALAFCQAELPLYVVLWIVQWLPAMYRLKDIEIVRLLEGVYGSAKRIKERRSANKTVRTE